MNSRTRLLSFRKLIVIVTAVWLIGALAWAFPATATPQRVRAAIPVRATYTLSPGNYEVRCPSAPESLLGTNLPFRIHCPAGNTPPTTVAPTTVPTTVAPTTTTAPTGPLATPASYFGADVTNQSVTSWPVANTSLSAVGALLGTGTVNTWLNEDRTILTVPSTQPEALMAEGTPTNGENWCGAYFSDNDANSAAPPAGNYNSLFYAPVPLDVYYSSASTDDEVAILKTGSDPQEYDFWLFGEGGKPTGSGNATYPGQVPDPFYSAGSPNLNAQVWDVGNGGQLSTNVNPPDFPNGCGDSASGLSVAATTITEQDVYNGSIDHALSLEVPWQLCTGDTYPATNPYPDCTGPGTALKEGDYFRLSSAADCSLTPALAALVCSALQNYGMIVMDRNTANPGSVFLEGENPNDWAFDGHGGTDPITAAIGSGNQGTVLSGIPWNDLQLITPPSNSPTLGLRGAVVRHTVAQS